jgi:hypothetical protein
MVTNDPEQILVSLMDGDFKLIGNLTLINSTRCLANLTDFQIGQVTGYGKYYYCFPGGISLTHSNINS